MNKTPLSTTHQQRGMNMLLSTLTHAKSVQKEQEQSQGDSAVAEACLNDFPIQK